MPEKLEALIDQKLIDYVAMDVKAPFEKYSKIAGVPVDIDKIKQSIKIIMLSPIDYEFRTTVGPEFLTKKDILKIAQQIKGAKKYVLQIFKTTKTLNPQFLKQKTYSEEELVPLIPKLKKWVKKVEIR